MERCIAWEKRILIDSLTNCLICAETGQECDTDTALLQNDMIIAERKEKAVIDKFDRFGEAMPDGRLTMPSEGKVYRLREAILLSKKLGRSLSEEEMKQLEVS